MSVHSYNTSLNANFKNVYADEIINLYPDSARMQKDISFVSAEKSQGGTYIQPVALTPPHGITFAASGSVFNLNASVPSTIKAAQVEGTQSLLREQISYDVAARAASGKNAFKQATKLVVEHMRKGHLLKNEAEMLWGGQGLGTIASISGNVLTMTTAEWASGLFTGAETMPVDFYTTTSFTKACTIASVNLESRTITVDNAVGLTAGDVLYFKGAYGAEFSGIYKILSNSGTLFNISASTYTLWRAPSKSASSAALNFNTVVKGIALAKNKGLDEMCRLYVNPLAFADLVNNIEAARTFGGDQYSPQNMERGTKSLKFYGPIAGEVEIVPHTMMKEGYAFAMVMDGSWVRIGATDTTFRLPGRPQDEFFLELENTAGYELRSFADFAPFCSRPGANCLFTSIVNAA